MRKRTTRTTRAMMGAVAGVLAGAVAVPGSGAATTAVKP